MQQVWVEWPAPVFSQEYNKYEEYKNNKHNVDTNILNWKATNDNVDTISDDGHSKTYMCLLRPKILLLKKKYNYILITMK